MIGLSSQHSYWILCTKEGVQLWFRYAEPRGIMFVAMGRKGFASGYAALAPTSEADCIVF